MSSAFLLYAATGFVGEATTRLAVEYGMAQTLSWNARVSHERTLIRK